MFPAPIFPNIFSPSPPPLVFRTGITDGSDPSSPDANPATTLRAAGTLRTGSLTPQGQKISLGAMLRLEVEPSSGTFRILVRAVHATVAVGIRQVLAAQLGGGGGGGLTQECRVTR